MLGVSAGKPRFALSVLALGAAATGDGRRQNHRRLLIRRDAPPVTAHRALGNLANLTDEVEGLFVRESNASTACGLPQTANSTGHTDRGCARVAVLVTAGFHNIQHGMNSRFNDKTVDGDHPLLAAWLRTTSLSLHRHVVDPNDADVFIYSWNPSLADAFDTLYAPVRAAYARNTPLMRKIKRGALPGCKGCSPQSVSWAFTIREAEVLMSGHERARGFQYDTIVFARPDVILFKDVNALELGADPRATVMPSPNWGDFFL